MPVALIDSALIDFSKFISVEKVARNDQALFKIEQTRAEESNKKFYAFLITKPLLAVEFVDFRFF